MPITPPPPAAHWCRSRRRHLPWNCAARYTAWSSLELDSHPLGSPLPHSSWYNTRNPLDIGRLSARIDVAPLAWYNTRPPGFHLPHCCVERIYSYHPVLCVCLAENIFIPPGIVHMFQRTVFIPPGIVRMFQRTVLIPPGIVRIFREQFLYHLVL